MPRFAAPLLLLMTLPLLLLLLFSPAAPPDAEPGPATLPAAATPAAPATYYLPPQPLAETPTVALLTASGVVQIDAESYLTGVVAAEMPVSFAAEALSAQAVAARSYLFAHSAPYGTPRHANAAVCADSSHCQAYLSEAELRQNWGAEFEQRYEKLSAAVTNTRGQVLWYAGAIAEAPFCSACGGSTEAAADLWGGERPYLTATACDFCRHAPRYRQTEQLPLTEAAARLNCTEAELYDMQLLAESSGGRVAALSIGGSSMSGAELRSKLSLPSAAFSWLISGEELHIFCRGYGHGVGMCQYGADGMAQQGTHFTAILSHYYPGTQLQQLY